MTSLSPPLVGLPPLIAALEGARTLGPVAPTTSGIAHDSRQVQPGAIFVAVRGARADGHAFLAQAVAAGAGAVVVDEAFAAAGPLPPCATAIVVADTRRALSRLAAAYYAYPSRSLVVVGVTGTNGKTTTTHLIAAMLRAGGVPAGCIGTLGASFGDRTWSLENTTPPALEVQSLLAHMRDGGAAVVAMEVSSHALALGRVADVDFALGALTNVTRDHLDFHADLDAYAAAKRSLFAHVRQAVLNLDDPYGRRWTQELAAARVPVVTYGCADAATIRGERIVVRADGSDFWVDERAFHSRLPGRFNIANALAAIGVSRAIGIGDDLCAQALAAFECVPGRMEHIGSNGIDVFVDYAHTPAALAAVLQTARETARGKLIVVFGCGGDRDRGKRPQMGRIAATLADRVVVTSDNPRSEDPSAIIAQIVAGTAARTNVVVELDRRAAIREAIASATVGDVVVVAGKGHESYQLIGTTSHHFDDRDEVRAALAARAALAR